MFEELKRSDCKCGKEHLFDAEVIIGEGAVNQLPDIITKLCLTNAFVIADKNTYAAAGESVCSLLEKNGISYNKYIFTKDILEPDDTNVGLAIMNFDPDCDLLIGVGSGVINDICKIIANISNKYYIIIGTAPSMDGYASATSSMIRDGFKVSVNSKCPDVIIGDTDILCKSPLKMMKSGLGDMLAKYVSICEWRIGNLILDEYYCEEIAALVRKSLKKCIDNAQGLLKCDKNAVEAVFAGLVISGAAMNFAGVSRPASGGEHYMSHIWDMRALEFGTAADFHGIQCAIATLIYIKLYEKLKTVKPDRSRALKQADDFDLQDWNSKLRELVGRSAESMIALEIKEQKYNKALHTKRLDRIIENWDGILNIIAEELPKSCEIERLLESLKMPATPAEIGIDNGIVPMTFKASKDIRDKYVLARLYWDLGLE